MSGYTRLVARVRLSPDTAHWIETLIRAFPDDRSAPEWLADRVRRMAALPLMLDMGGCYAIRADGELLEFDWDDPDPCRPVDDPRLINVALHQGSLRYRQLRSLEPSRPTDASDCPHCRGTGTLALNSQPGLEDLVCYCGGVGWLPN
jgi:hypothetical protein